MTFPPIDEVWMAFLLAHVCVLVCWVFAVMHPKHADVVLGGVAVPAWAWIGIINVALILWLALRLLRGGDA